MRTDLRVRRSPEPLWHLAAAFREEDADTACGIYGFRWTQAVVDSYLNKFAHDEKLGRVVRCLACGGGK